MTGTWATLGDVRAWWADAPLDDALLGQMIAAAHSQCVAVALASVLEAVAAGDPPPPAYVQAECIQTQAIGQSRDRDGDVIGFGPEGYAVRVRPLGADVKALLRPPAVPPRLG